MKKSASKPRSAYARAGVDIDNKMRALRAIKRMVHDTSTPGVVSDIGLFGGLFQSPGKDCLLVASTDGVGTKLKVAGMAGRHDTVGQDIVNHCVNDILVQGATPLFFMDYVGTARFEGPVFRQVVKGLCKACRENGCALLGGETAEMPGLYPIGEYDLVGTIVGVVRKRDMITGTGIRPGDRVIGLPSTGLHTNGFSLARRVIFEQAKLRIRDRLPGTSRTVADTLLAVHRSYLRPIVKLMQSVRIQGMAHITGGGVIDNIPRILPAGTRVIINTGTAPVLPVFPFIQRHGKVETDEMYRVFNMGIGMVIIVRPNAYDKALQILRKAGEKPFDAGEVTTGKRDVRLRHGRQGA
ncbi:MAG: phosphoribosylformylglycinamidine cyclo-ligase [Lentisphaerae bacterium RIFOXYC12_FULL_60_16]|nr:MAG: phosphoribosylformylglycinamidine cyclo-ligase [Lentisphaerae bacterium RIFOXYC12_FULL_60_16]OGV74210.1 MAG: phosphoribosylformylglycinamidine cyclo-ligase [Lentisphaerae bacterium RIFOXYA12_FULL_60_10]OGV83432.1 MAG: phosphoribosylformylglycinamidine cyclo-ligase [Lentisphaerae bacterium RIFOXYB12_FULL_60_10]